MNEKTKYTVTFTNPRCIHPLDRFKIQRSVEYARCEQDVRDMYAEYRDVEIVDEAAQERAEMEQAERDNFIATGLDRDGEDTGISQPVIF